MTESSTYAGASGGKINLSASQFRTGIQLYPLADQEMFEWLWGYLSVNLRRQVKLLERELGVPYLDIYNAFTGRPTDRYSEILRRAAELKRDELAHLRIVQTPVTAGIMETLDYARDYSCGTAVVGPTGRGKTYTARYWQALNNHGRTRYVRMSSSASRSSLIYALCDAAGTGFRGYKNSELEQRIFSSLSRRNVLIIDEAGHLIPTGSGKASALELVRDIQDITGCGVCLIFTDVYLEQIKLGPNRRYFEQFVSRLEKTYRIPEQPEKNEVAAVVKSYTEKPSRELLTLAYDSARAGDGKLRTLFRDLDRASLLADTEGHELTADDLRTAITLRTSCASWSEEDAK